jgi:hypothetical protein
MRLLDMTETERAAVIEHRLKCAWDHAMSHCQKETNDRGHSVTRRYPPSTGAARRVIMLEKRGKRNHAKEST